MNEERLLSGREAAKLLGMSQAWLYQSDVPHVKLGRRRLYRARDLRAFVSRRVRK
jgi:predicted DNA-binding transcriptional regulator AlpA